LINRLICIPLDQIKIHQVDVYLSAPATGGAQVLKIFVQFGHALLGSEYTMDAAADDEGNGDDAHDL